MSRAAASQNTVLPAYVLQQNTEAARDEAPSLTGAHIVRFQMPLGRVAWQLWQDGELANEFNTRKDAMRWCADCGITASVPGRKRKSAS